jgi:Haem-degrading
MELDASDNRNKGESLMKKTRTWIAAAVAMAAGLSVGSAYADTCGQLSAAGLNDASLKSALRTVVPTTGTPNGGLGFPMWLTLVDGSGIVCAVTNSLDGSAGNADVTADIWLGSRVISAQKANAANAFSTGKLALSTANLYSAVQPGGSLYGLQASNPVDATQAYDGKATDFGTPKDPLAGNRIGGINVFGGGLALYNNGKKIGAIGVSGDTSCTDHVVAWKVRASTPFATVPVFGAFDAMFQDITPNPYGGTGISASGFGHPRCLFNPTAAQAGAAIIGN